MDILQSLLHALWQQDYETLSDPTLVWAIYGVLFMILFLENGLLPAAFLPVVSLLILVGVLIATGTMRFPLTILVLSTGASLGCWVSYLPCRWLGHTPTGPKRPSP
ncbi:MAG TPA: DedA family protein, partial [Pantoea agglomerans]|nr:DedA family protein [Pantoea agglomerans]